MAAASSAARTSPQPPTPTADLSARQLGRLAAASPSNGVTAVITHIHAASGLCHNALGFSFGEEALRGACGRAAAARSGDVGCCTAGRCNGLPPPEPWTAFYDKGWRPSPHPSLVLPCSFHSCCPKGCCCTTAPAENDGCCNRPETALVRGAVLRHFVAADACPLPCRCIYMAANVQ